MRKLPNYFHTFRRRASLTQCEIAYLLGGQSSARVSHYERFHRKPNLKTALSFMAIFQTPVHILCAGEHERVKREVQARAKRLAAKIATQTLSPLATRKLAFLHALATASSEPLSS